MKKLHITRKWILPFCLIVILTVLGGWFLLQKFNKSENTVHALCNNDTIGTELKSKYANFSAKKVGDMTDFVSSITATEKYDQSVNCLYILGRYNMFKGIPDQAVTYFEKLIAIHEKDDVWIDASVGNEKLEAIKESIEHLNAQKDTFTSKNDRVPSLGVGNDSTQ